MEIIETPYTGGMKKERSSGSGVQLKLKKEIEFYTFLIKVQSNKTLNENYSTGFLSNYGKLFLLICDTVFTT